MASLESYLLPKPIANSAVKHLKNFTKDSEKRVNEQNKNKGENEFSQFPLFPFVFLMQVCHINSVFYPKLS